MLKSLMLSVDRAKDRVKALQQAGASAVVSPEMQQLQEKLNAMLGQMGRAAVNLVQSEAESTALKIHRLLVSLAAAAIVAANC